MTIRKLAGRALVIAACAMPGAVTAQAADFFSTAECPSFLDFGVRLGVNTSNRTISTDAFPNCYSHENWGTGFDLGVVADLNIRDYIAIQPGVFFGMQRGTFTLMGSPAGSGLPDDGSQTAQAGSRRSFGITVPVVATVRFNITDDLRWSVDAGPYVAFTLGSSVKTRALVSDSPDPTPLFSQKPASVDFGFKMGTGLQLKGRYYIGAHYMAGCLGAWKDRTIGNLTKTYGGVTKTWTFTLGYDF